MFSVVIKSFNRFEKVSLVDRIIAISIFRMCIIDMTIFLYFLINLYKVRTVNTIRNTKKLQKLKKTEKIFPFFNI